MYYKNQQKFQILELPTQPARATSHDYEIPNVCCRMWWVFHIVLLYTKTFLKDVDKTLGLQDGGGKPLTQRFKVGISPGVKVALLSISLSLVTTVTNLSFQLYSSSVICVETLKIAIPLYLNRRETVQPKIEQFHQAFPDI